MVDYEKILNEIGLITRPQWIQLLILTLPTMLAAAHMTVMVFIGYTQRHVCSEPRIQQINSPKCNVTWAEQLIATVSRDEATESAASCARFDFVNCTLLPSNTTTAPCRAWIYDTSVFNTTVTSDFDLVCHDKQQGRLSQSVFMFGVVLGTAMWGQVSDKIGRRIAAIVPLLIGIGFSIAAAYSATFFEFTVHRFFVGFTIFPAFSCCYVLGAETVNQEHKVWVTQAFQCFFSLGICSLAAIAYFIRDWRTLELAISFPGIATLVLMWFTFESPRWLISCHQYSKANAIVTKLMKSGKNLHSLEAKKLKVLSMMQKDKAASDKPKKLESGGSEKEFIITAEKTRRDTIVAILKLPNMRKKSFILYYEWMVTSALYYGLTLNSAELGGNVFVNLFLSAVVEIPATMLAIPMIQKWGRRPTLTSTLFLSGTVCICMLFVSKELVWLNVTLATTGKFLISATFGTAYVYTTDIYPTTVRNVGIGVCSSWARIGGMLAPFIAMLDVAGFAVPYITFGSMAIVGGFLGLLLPEVLGKKNPENLKEAEEFGKNDTLFPFNCCGTNRHCSGKAKSNTEDI